jgi:hypothetical protein
MYLAEEFNGTFYDECIFNAYHTLNIMLPLITIVLLKLKLLIITFEIYAYFCTVAILPYLMYCVNMILDIYMCGVNDTACYINPENYTDQYNTGYMLYHGKRSSLTTSLVNIIFAMWMVYGYAFAMASIVSCDRYIKAQFQYLSYLVFLFTIWMCFGTMHIQMMIVYFIPTAMGEYSAMQNRSTKISNIIGGISVTLICALLLLRSYSKDPEVMDIVFLPFYPVHDLFS